MEKNNKLINLISSLIKSFKDYDKNLKKRFKVDTIFLGFEENANKNLSKLINLSDSRYKSVKYGIKLNSILNNQKCKYKDLNEGIKNDKLYSSNILEPEKSKLFKSVVSFKNKEIYDIRDKLINTLRINKEDKKNGLKRYDSKARSETKISTLKIRMPSNNRNNIYIKSPIKKKLISYSNKNLFTPKLSEHLDDVDDDGLTENQKLIDKLMKEDYKTFFSKMNSYHNFLNKLKSLSNEYHKGKGIKINKDNFDHIISGVSPKRLKFLSYNDQYQPYTTQKNKKKDLEFDLKTIQKIKLDHIKNNNNFVKNKINKSNKTTYSPSISNYNNIIGKNKSLVSRSELKTNFSMTNTIDNNNDFNRKEPLIFNSSRNRKIFDEKKNYNFKNTANIVFNETENGLFYGQNFLNKTKSFNNYFNKCFKKKRKKLKINIDKDDNNNNNIYNYKPQNENLRKNSSSKKIEIKEYYQKDDKENIRREFQTIYEQKKLEWKKEEKLKELERLKDMKKKKEIENFLLEATNNNLLKKQ